MLASTTSNARRQIPARRDDRLLRPQRFRQNLARDGHDLRRRPAPLRRKPELATPASSSARCRSRKVDHIDGLSPAIASSKQRRATARARPSAPSPKSTITSASSSPASASRHCPKCDIPIGTQTTDQIVDKCCHSPEGTEALHHGPAGAQGAGEVRNTLGGDSRRRLHADAHRRQDATRVDEPPTIDHRRKHAVEVIVDRNVVKPGTRTRIAEAVEKALDLGRGVMHIAHVDADHGRNEMEGRAYSAASGVRKMRPAASRRSTRTTTHSTARSAGARRAKASASSAARTRTS